MRYTHIDQMLPLNKSVFNQPEAGNDLVHEFVPSVVTTPRGMLSNATSSATSQTREDSPQQTNTSISEVLPINPYPTPNRPIALRRSSRVIKPRQILDL